MGATILPAIITGGAARRDPITGPQVLPQRGALRIAAGSKHGPDLVTELTGMRVKVGGEGRARLPEGRSRRDSDESGRIMRPDRWA